MANGESIVVGQGHQIEKEVAEIMIDFCCRDA